MPSPVSELWDMIANAVLDDNQEVLAEIAQQQQFGYALVNMVIISINARVSFEEVLKGENDLQIGAQSFQSNKGPEKKDGH